MSKSVKLRGASRMREQGYRQVMLWLSPDEWALIRRAAKLRCRGGALATFARKAAILHATACVEADRPTPLVKFEDDDDER